MKKKQNIGVLSHQEIVRYHRIFRFLSVNSSPIVVHVICTIRHYCDGIMYAMASQITRPHDCLLNRSCRCRSKKTSKLRATGLCAWNSPVTGEFTAQMASNAEYVSIWWRHHETGKYGNVWHASVRVLNTYTDCTHTECIVEEQTNK